MEGNLQSSVRVAGGDVRADCSLAQVVKLSRKKCSRVVFNKENIVISSVWEEVLPAFFYKVLLDHASSTEEVINRTKVGNLSLLK